MSISATRARVALGSATTTSSPLEFFTLSEYFGSPGVPASFAGTENGLSGGASTFCATLVSAAISILKIKPGNLRAAAQKERKYDDFEGSRGSSQRLQLMVLVASLVAVKSGWND